MLCVMDLIDFMAMVKSELLHVQDLELKINQTKTIITISYSNGNLMDGHIAKLIELKAKLFAEEKGYGATVGITKTPNKKSNIIFKL